MENYELFLKELKDKINALPEDNTKRQELLSIYNGEIEDLLQFLNKPLDEECEISEELMLADYIEFKDDYNKNGYYTFKKFIDDRTIIAEVKAKKVRWWGKKIHVEIKKVFKGQIQKN
ncbi:hypothetical protein [Acetivibrio cellulolyticus]|uniref:hypothetical protein n=1 Tax=Acetivibrio cellulolyticus TaxID=35830 RepID=UPI0001E305D1|nr:hypothetical protein [Acetivibrio cellulolyticus]